MSLEMILAGDIGGTKTVLALYVESEQGELQCQKEQIFVSADYRKFDDVLSVFLEQEWVIDKVCFGVAGPIVNQRCQTTNLPWVIDAAELSNKFGTQQIKLLNDLEAMAIGLLHSADEDLLELNPNAQLRSGNIAVIAAGTGLGEAILYWDGERHHPIATEGGHCDFAAQTAQQDALSNYLRQYFKGHVSWERILSGDGFGHLYDFLVETGFAPPCHAVSASINSSDRNAVISRLGLIQEDPVCIEVMKLFVELYAAEAGNLALKCMATGGVYIGGGIGPKIRSVMQSELFMQSFVAKGRFENLLSELSVKLALNPKAGLMGAAYYISE